MKKRLAIILLAVLFVGSELQAQNAAKPELRTWNDSTGQFSIQAIFVRINGDQVVLQRTDKKEISLPLAKLSVADQQYVKKRLTPAPSKSTSQEAITALLQVDPRASIKREEDHIVSLSLNSSKVADADLVHLKELTNLRVLSINYTQISGAGLVHLKGLTNLRQLSFHKTQISGAVLVHLEGLTNLTRLSLSNTQITDAELEHLKGLTKLEALDLASTQITDAGLAHLQSLVNLSALYLKNTKISGPGLRYLLNSPITVLSFRESAALGDSSVEHIANLKSLTKISLHETSITRDGLTKLSLLLPRVPINWSPRPNPIDLAFHSFNNWNSKPVFINSTIGDVVQEFREGISFSQNRHLAVYSGDDRNKTVKPTALNIMFSFSDVRSEAESGMLSNRVKEIQQQYLHIFLGTQGTVRFMGTVIEKFQALGDKGTRTKGTDGSNHIKWSYPQWKRVVTLDIYSKQEISMKLTIIRVP